MVYCVAKKCDVTLFKNTHVETDSNRLTLVLKLSCNSQTRSSKMVLTSLFKKRLIPSQVQKDTHGGKDAKPFSHLHPRRGLLLDTL